MLMASESQELPFEDKQLPPSVQHEPIRMLGREPNQVGSGCPLDRIHDAIIRLSRRRKRFHTETTAISHATINAVEATQETGALRSVRPTGGAVWIAKRLRLAGGERGESAAHHQPEEPRSIHGDLPYGLSDNCHTPILIVPSESNSCPTIASTPPTKACSM